MVAYWSCEITLFLSMFAMCVLGSLALISSNFLESKGLDMEQLRGACSSLMAETRPSEPAVQPLIHSFLAPFSPSAEIVDSTASNIVERFITDISEFRFDCGVVAAVLSDLIAMGGDACQSTVAELRLNSALGFLLSIPERLLTGSAEFKFSEMLRDNNRYLQSFAKAIFLSSSTPLWSSFCKVCVRRGLLECLIQLFQNIDRNGVNEQRLLELCSSLSSVQRKLVQFLIGTATSTVVAKWFVAVAMEHDPDSCFRLENGSARNPTRSLLQNAIQCS
jgi:hypothetical protein